VKEEGKQRLRGKKGRGTGEERYDPPINFGVARVAPPMA